MTLEKHQTTPPYIVPTFIDQALMADTFLQNRISALILSNACEDIGFTFGLAQPCAGKTPAESGITGPPGPGGCYARNEMEESAGI